MPFKLDKKYELDKSERKIPESVWSKLADPNLIGAPQDPKALEVLPSVGSSMLATPIAGLASLLALGFGGKEHGQGRLGAAGKTLETVAGALTYEPRTERGQEVTEQISKPFEWWHDVATKYGDVGENKWTPALQSLIEASPMAIPFLRKGVRKISPVELKKARTPKQMAEGVESRFVKSEFEKAFLDKPKPDMVGAPEYIEAAAIKMKDGTIYKGATHHLAMEKYDAAGHSIRDWKKLVDDPDGFVTGEGKFITREKARKMAGNKPGEIDATEIVGKYMYSGIPAREFTKLGDLWSKKIATPIWDRLTFDKIPAFLGKMPGGEKVIRAGKFVKKQLDPEYRGDLPQTKGFVKSVDQKKTNQAIGREYGIDLGQRLNAFPEDSQLRIGEFIRGERKGKKLDLSSDELTMATEAVEALKHLGKQAVDAGLLSEEVYFKNWGRYMPRLYTSKEYTTLLDRFNLPKPNRLDLSRFKKRKDIPKEIREQMGEILTPGYPVAKGITQLTHDIELTRFFNGVAKNPQWAVPKSMIKDSGIPEGFMQLPSNKKLGALSDAYVHPEIFNELQQTVRVMQTPERVWRRSLGYWKFGKVILSPKTHVRNLMSNSVLAHLGGMPMYEQPIYLTKAIKEMRGKGDYWRAAKQEGLLSRTWTSGELKELFNQVEGQMAGIKPGSVVDSLGVAGKAFDKTKKGMKKAANLYEAEEQWFKMAKMIHNIERRGMTPKAAAADAEKWLFNYSKVTSFQEKYRSKWYGAPFATFTFKALPRISEAAIKTPWRFALPAGMIYALQQAAMSEIGDTPEQFKAKQEIRPDWQKGNFLGVIPNFARFPFVDDYGREHNLNLTYILPWGDIGEGGDFMGIPGSLRPMSQPFVNEAFQQIANRDIFWDENIVRERDIAGLKGAQGKKPGQVWNPTTEAGRTALKLRGGHLAKTMLPTPVLDIKKGIDAIQGRPDVRGRFKDPMVAAADALAGVKLYPIDYADQLVRKINQINPSKGYVAQKIRGEIKSFSIKRKAMVDAGKPTKFYDELIQTKIKQLKGLGEETREVSETYRKTKGERYGLDNH